MKKDRKITFRIIELVSKRATATKNGLNQDQKSYKVLTETVDCSSERLWLLLFSLWRIDL